MVTACYIKNGEMSRFMRLLDEWLETNNEYDRGGRFNVYTRQLHGMGIVAIVSSLKNGLAEFDESNEFRQYFIDTHGEERCNCFWPIMT